MDDEARALYKEANWLFNEGKDKDGALQKFKDVVEKFPDSVPATWAREKIEVLESGDFQASSVGGSIQVNVSIQVMKFFAIFELIVGPLAGILFILITKNFMGVAIGIGIALQGVLFGVSLLVFAGIAEDVKQIRENTAIHGNSQENAPPTSKVQ